MANIEKMIDFGLGKVGRVGYSMAYPARLGPAFYDCSSFVHYCLIAGGFIPRTSLIGSTETLFKMNGTYLKEIYSYDQVQRGDIFIRGIEGKSLGAGGHTGIFLAKDKILHANYRHRGVSISTTRDDLKIFLACKRSYKERYFRPLGNTNTGYKMVEKLGRALVRAAVNVRALPTTRSDILAVYYPGEHIHYDQVIENEGLSWISYIALSGKRRYVSIGDGKSTWVKI